MSEFSAPSFKAGEAPIEATMSLDPSSTIEKMKDLLQAKDDTSRFVGLALLKSVLDNGQLAQDTETLRSLWEAMSPKFFDRLLRAPQSEKVNKAESKDMADLAVAVLHTFAILLPVDSRKEKRWTARAGPLVMALLQRYVSNLSSSLSTQLTSFRFSRNHKAHLRDAIDHCQST